MATPDTKTRPGAPPATQLPEVTHYRRTRKLAHLVCFLVFLALPFFNVMRFDLPRQRFYFAGRCC